MSQDQSIFISDKLDSLEFEYSQIPTMISEEEKRYLYFLGKDYWSGFGNIVEIGPWLGGSTYCLAAGFSNNPKRKKEKIVVYDNFIWRSFMSQRAKLPLGDGDDFSPFFKKNLKKYSDIVIHKKASLPDENIENDQDAILKRQFDHKEIPLITYQDSMPVEILFIDGAKSWAGTIHMFNEFHQSFIKGRTLLVCQDYKYWGCYWVIIIMEYFSEVLSYEHILPANSIAFKMNGEITREMLDRVPSFEKVSVEEGINMIDKAAGKIKSVEGYESYLIIKLNEVKFLAHKGAIDQAEEKLNSLIRRHPFYMSKNQFKGIVKWFNASYQRNVDIRDSLFFRAMRKLKSILT